MNGRDDIEVILEKYADMIFRVAYVQMKNKDEAEDIFQEVCLKILHHTKEFASEEHLKAWLIRVTVNCCKNFWNSAWWRKVTVDSQKVEMMRRNLSEELDYGESVTDFVKRLPEKYRIVIHLYYYEEYSVKEIAGILQSKENTVFSRLHRGRKMLKDMFKKGGKKYEF